MTSVGSPGCRARIDLTTSSLVRAVDAIRYRSSASATA